MRQDKTRQDKTRQGKTRQDKTRQETHLPHPLLVVGLVVAHGVDVVGEHNVALRRTSLGRLLTANVVLAWRGMRKGWRLGRGGD